MRAVIVVVTIARRRRRLPADLTDSETQSIHAWSQADHAEAVTTYIRRRSWKMPIALAVAGAAAVIGVGVYQERPQHHALPAPPAQSTPSVAPAPPKPESKDEKFIRLMREQHLLRVDSPGPNEMMAQEAPQVCRRIDGGETATDVIRNVQAGTPVWSLSQAEAFVSTAMNVYCPQYLH